MKRWTAFLGTFILSYLFWILFLMQDFNILKLGAQEIIVGAIVAAIVSLFSSQYFAREDGMWLFKKFRIINSKFRTTLFKGLRVWAEPIKSFI